MINRITAAILGGYALTAAAMLLLARIPIFAPLDRLLASMMMTFALYAAVIIWSFTTRSATRAWVFISAGTLGCELFAWLLGKTGA